MQGETDVLVPEGYALYIGVSFEGTPEICYDLLDAIMRERNDPICSFGLCIPYPKSADFIGFDIE